VSAELAARVTAAAAVAADFDREVDAYLDRPPGTAAPDYSRWAFRMRAEVRSLIDGIAGIPADDPAQKLAAIRTLFQTFCWETDDQQYALEQIEEIVHGDDQ